MLRPDEVAEKAKQKEKENLRFRSYLKTHADPEKLDAQFKELHEELFPEYDCSACRNCCKKCVGCIPTEDIDKDASFLGISSEEFIEKYLDRYDSDSYVTKNCPCDFWDENTGDCILADHRPESCKKYPHTDQPDRIGGLWGIVESAGICPVVYEIFERLKEEYHFVTGSRRRVYPNAPCPCGSGRKFKKCCGRYR